MKTNLKRCYANFQTFIVTPLLRNEKVLITFLRIKKQKQNL